MDIGALITVLLSIIDKTMGMMPNYSQRKKQDFYDMVSRYHAEMSLAKDARDDNYIQKLYTEIIDFAKAFQTEINNVKAT